MMTILCRLSLFQEWDKGIISFYIIGLSNEMFNIMERSHGCKVMEYLVVGTYHFNFVNLCDNIKWWPALVWLWWLFQEWDMDTISLDISSPSNEMFNFMERFHGCKVMECPVVETNHFNFVCLCDNITCWPLFGVGDCSKSEIWVQYHSILIPRQMRCSTSWKGLMVVKLWNIQ